MAWARREGEIRRRHQIHLHRATTRVMRARTNDDANASRVRIGWDVEDESTSAETLARAIERGARVALSASDGFRRAETIWKVYDVVGGIGDGRGDVVLTHVATGASRGDAELVERSSGTSDADAAVVDAGRRARDRALAWASTRSESERATTSYDFTSNGTRKHVSVGGTFDRLHAGHRALLATAMRLVEPNGTLYVGVTSEALLRNKKYGELLEGYEDRADAVRAFLLECRDLSSPVDVRVGPLDEGPPLAATVREMSALVVSRETIVGAEALNDMRVEAGFDPLDIIVVDLIGASASGDGTKLSSTALRAADAAKNRPT